MATLAQTYLSLADVYRRSEDADAQRIADIIEIKHTLKGAIDDWMLTECNLGTKHKTTYRGRIPQPNWGALYQGVANSKSTTTQVEDTTGFFEDRCEVDVRMDEVTTNLSDIRLSEAIAHIEGMNQFAETTFFYSNSDTNPLSPKGLAPRYATYGTRDTTGTARQVVHGGGSGSDNTSIWFVTHGMTDTCVIYPKGTMGGIRTIDHGKQPVLDGSSNGYFAYVEEFRQHMGISVKDWRNNARICNVDVSAIRAGTVDLYGLMRQAYYRLHTRRAGKIDNQMGIGRTSIYCNTDVLEALDALSTNAGSDDSFIRLRPMEIEGKEVMTYRGMPIRETDALLNTEALVPAAS